MRLVDEDFGDESLVIWILEDKDFGRTGSVKAGQHVKEREAHVKGLYKVHVKC